MLVVSIPIFVSCKKDKANVELPQNITLNNEESEPILKVYNTETKTISEMGLETYIQGVLAGEIFNSWPDRKSVV